MMGVGPAIGQVRGAMWPDAHEAGPDVGLWLMQQV